MTSLSVRVPDLGDFNNVSIIEVLVQVGDSIRAEQSLITVESDKASLEIPSSHAGVVTSLAVKLGDTINAGDVILEIEVADASSAPSPAATAAPVTTTTAAATATTAAPAEAATAPSASSGNPDAPKLLELRIPELGDFANVSVIEVLVQVGDTIVPEQSLITVESDKASMEIPASFGGTLESLSVKLGDTVNVGDLIGTVLGTAGAAQAASPSPAPAAVPAPPPTPAPAAVSTTPAPVPAPAPAAASAVGQLPHASPSVRKFARELGVPLAQVAGSGKKGRITQADVQAYTRGIMQAAQNPATSGPSAVNMGDFSVSAWPQVDFSQFGPTERSPLSRIQKISGTNLHRNWVRIPHVTNHDDADITELEALRVQLNAEQAKAKSDTKVTMLAFIIKACVAALQKFPQFNASLDGDELVLKQYYHIGFAADTPRGLMVPVIKNADQKGILQISQELAELSALARSGKISPADMQGASFTISSLGGIGGTYFTPIINAPEVAILGVCRSSMRPTWDGQTFQPRLILPLSLSWDHRVIDGAAAARFNAYIGQVLADFRRVML